MAPNSPTNCNNNNKFHTNPEIYSTHAVVGSVTTISLKINIICLFCFFWIVGVIVKIFR